VISFNKVSICWNILPISTEEIVLEYMAHSHLTNKHFKNVSETFHYGWTNVSKKTFYKPKFVDSFFGFWNVFLNIRWEVIFIWFFYSWLSPYLFSTKTFWYLKHCLIWFNRWVNNRCLSVYERGDMEVPICLICLFPVLSLWIRSIPTSQINI
jgi:hypothetical protein